MHFRSNLVLILILTFYEKLGQSENIPCNTRRTSAGYVCVCNATYCDTVERPTPLPRGLYLHYSTAKESPGFSVAKGKFLNSRKKLYWSSNDMFIKVDSRVQYQSFEGFGASVTGASGIMINSLPPTAQEKFFESYFGEAGLEYNIIRVPVAASDFTPRYYTYDDVPGDVDLKYFNLTEEDFTLKIPILKMAINTSKRGVKLVASTWTAPSWMKTNNDSKLGYIYNKYLPVWASYHLKFLQAYKENDIEFWGLTLGNEVNIAMLFGQWFPIQNTQLPPQVARYWTKKYLGPLLKSSGFENVKLLAMDDERAFLQWYMDRMFADKEAAQYINGAALHWYLDTSSNLHLLQDFHNKYPDKFILYTESSINFFNSHGGGAVDIGDWDRAVQYIENIISNLNHWVVGYIDWNIALDEQGGPSGPANLTLDAAVIVNKTTGEFYKQPIFYAIGHFSKFIPPGAKKINITVNQPIKDDGCFQFDGTEINSLGFELLPCGTPVSNSPNYSTEAPFPTWKPDPPVTEVSALATTNPDGSITIVAYNPRSEPVNLVIMDSKVGVLNQTVDAYSLNSFIYW